MSVFLIFLLGILIGFTSSAFPKFKPIPPLYEEANLFKADIFGYHYYRIPGIIMTSKGTLIAWSEARKEQGDWTDIDIMRRHRLPSLRKRGWNKTPHIGQIKCSVADRRERLT
jgi:hypothetical protein